ncbi:hypothetical protein F5972_08515 [Microbispora cellulosiformans]|uniref:Uncharacterized protein n=1 Tax=Microbispora cellulosiformans TaxID=2614688 RepID=A0A5J5K507_9ACTN|nr:hypothetical protein [Microbispora cellulosiformans]KAA9379685.1 hypothetical protein F5972_08515 [Microbispora cellulosiformans]
MIPFELMWTEDEPAPARDRLVATGDPAADAYLRAGLGLPGAEYADHLARQSWQQAVADDDRLYGFRGTAERRQTAERRYDTARHERVVARTATRLARRDAEQSNPAAAALVTAELGTVRAVAAERTAARAAKDAARQARAERDARAAREAARQ